MTREQWLLGLTDLARPWFRDAAGLVIPEVVRVSVGFPSRSIRKVIGQCFYHARDGAPQIFIHPMLEQPTRVADVTVHELIHASLPAGTEHKAPFARAARALLLEGKPTATVASEAFLKQVAPWLKKLGPYPHAALEPGGQERKQSTRLLKAECPECGLIFRITAKWLDACDGELMCPNPYHDDEPIRMEVDA